jgi:hypothetical protein
MPLLRTAVVLAMIALAALTADPGGARSAQPPRVTVIGDSVLDAVQSNSGPRSILKQGFDVYLDPPKTGQGSFFHQDERTAAQVTDDCLRLLEANALAPPFFLWAHYFDPHFPYEPPEPFLTRFLSRAAPGGKGRARYAGEVAFMDQEIGRLLDRVRARMGTRPLVILAVADHGEALGDHGEDSHGMLLYDPTVRVPLLLAGSGVPRGVVVDEPVSTVDVAPTLLELAGVKIPDAAELAGVSLLAGVRDIPQDYLEAARLDGANTFQVMWHITLPLLRPVLLFVVVIATTNALTLFAQPYLLTHGGPGDATRPLAELIYDTAFSYLNIGEAAAISLVLLLLAMGVAYIQFWVLRPKI